MNFFERLKIEKEKEPEDMLDDFLWPFVTSCDLLLGLKTEINDEECGQTDRTKRMTT